MTAERPAQIGLLPAAFAPYVADRDREVVVRPLGEIRESLETLLSELTERERRLLSTRYGLSGFPTGADEIALARRVLPMRRRRHPGLRQRRLRDLTEQAFAALDARAPGVTADPPLPPAPAGEPALAPWFVGRIKPNDRFPTLLEAIIRARVYVGAFGRSKVADAVARNLSEYHDALLRQWPPRRALGRSRARAVVALSLWEVVHQRRRWSTLLAPEATGVVASRCPIEIGDAALAPFLAGNRETGAIIAACAVATRVAAADQQLGRVLADLLAGAYSESLSAEASVALLQAVVRIRSTDEDPSAVTLALAASTRHPIHWRTLATEQAAVKVATAFGAFAFAERVLRRMTTVLDAAFDVPAGRDIEVERVEQAVWVEHQWTGTLRRMLDDGHDDPELLERALQRSQAAIEHWRAANALAHEGATGDFSERWLFFLAVREAELRLAEARIYGTTTVRGSRALGDAERAERVATEIADRFRIADEERVPLLKVELARTILEGDLASATALLWRLHELRWPVGRSLPPLAAIAKGFGQDIIDRRLVESVLTIAGAERDQGWVPLVEGRADVWREVRVRDWVRQGAFAGLPHRRR